MRTVDIKGYPNYTISEDGTVISKKRVRKNGVLFDSFTKKNTKNDKGYLVITLRNDNGRTTLKLHRLVAEAFIPNPNNYPQINHIDGNKSNAHYTNLEWCTQSMNMKHSVHVLGNKPFGGKGTAGVKGEDNPRSKTIVRIYPNGEERIYHGIQQACREIRQENETISEEKKIAEKIRRSLNGIKKHYLGTKWRLKNS